MGAMGARPLALMWITAVAGLAPAQTAPATRQVVRNVCISPDGKFVAGTVGGPGAVYVWSITGGKPRVLHREAAGIPGVAYSPDGIRIAIGTYQNEAKLIDAANGKVLDVFSGHSKPVRTVVFSPDGRTLLTG